MISLCFIENNRYDTLRGAHLVLSVLNFTMSRITVSTLVRKRLIIMWELQIHSDSEAFEDYMERFKIQSMTRKDVKYDKTLAFSLYSSKRMSIAY